jgi:maltose operon periplasmic protein
MSFHRGGWLASLLLLAGCAAAPQPYPAGLGERFAAYERAAACCSDPAQFDYTPLPGAGTVQATIGSSSPAFEFHSGLSHFAAFRLPEGGEPYRVRIKSLFDGEPPGGSLFYPVVAMLDESFIVTRVSGLENLRLEPSLARPGAEAGLALVAPFDPSVSRERYIVVFTPAVLLGAPPEERSEGDMVTLPAIDWLRRNERRVLDPSPYGRLEILVAPAQPPGSG